MARAATKRKTDGDQGPVGTMTLAPAARTEAVRLRVEQLIESPLNPRKHEQVDKDLDDLARSIAEHDVIESLVVRPSNMDLPHGAALLFEIVAGSRRWKAAKLAGREDVPCVIRDVTDLQLLELAFAENAHRRQMHALDEARALVKFAEMDPIYRDDRVLAARIGRSETYVRDRRKLLKCGPEVIAALDADAITAKHAERIARLPAAQHSQALAACFSNLWHNLDLAQKDIKAGRWEKLRGELGTLEEFDRWAEQYAMVDVTDADVQRELPELGAAAAKAEELANGDAAGAAEIVAQSFLPVSTRSYNVPKGVVPAGEWVEAKKACEHAQRAIVAHGGAPRLLDVCAKRSCTVHFPKPKTPKAPAAAKPSAAEQKQREQDKQRAAVRRREEELFGQILPQLKVAFAKHVSGLKLTLQLLQVATENGYLDYEWVRGVKRDWGVVATDRNLGEVIALRCVATESGQTDSTQFIAETKPFKFDAKGVIAKLSAARKKAAAAPAPAKKTARKK